MFVIVATVPFCLFAAAALSLSLALCPRGMKSSYTVLGGRLTQIEYYLLYAMCVQSVFLSRKAGWVGWRA